MRDVRPWPLASEPHDGPLRLAADRVDCWFVSLAAFPSDAERLAISVLSEDERERAARFHFARQRERYIRSHAALRLLLARYLMAAPDAVVIVAKIHGRPALAAPADGLQFNLSHSGDAMLVGVARHSAVGIDIEMVRDIPDLLAIARRHFAPTEIEELLRMPAAQRCEGFHVTWTRKEAFIKALGLGLSFPLDAFCTGGQDRPPRLRQGGADCSDWTIVDVAPARGYKAAVAVHHPNATLQCREAGWSWLLAQH